VACDVVVSGGEIQEMAATGQLGMAAAGQIRLAVVTEG
jgi:hypothetical protein